MVTKVTNVPLAFKSIAADLRALGIRQPRELAGLEPLAVYRRLAGVMGGRHDPCVLYALMAVRHFFDSGEARPWWQFAAEGRRLLQLEAPPRPGRRSGRA